MSDQKRATLTTLGTSKSDKKSKEVQRKTIRLNLTLAEPNEDSCPVFKYPALLNAEEKKLRLKESRGEGGKTLNGSFNTFDDDDEESIRRIARQFEEKYGGGDRRHNRCHTYAELGAGYDETDSFIDNTEAYEEALPEEMQTAHGGYYINCGQLEFKRVEVSDHSDLDEVKARRRHKKGVKVIEDEEEEEEEAEEGDEDDEAEDDDDDDDDDGDDDDEAAEDNEDENPAEPSPKPVEPSPPSLPKKVKIAEEPPPPLPPPLPPPPPPPPLPPVEEPVAAPSVELVPPLKLKRPAQPVELPEPVKKKKKHGTHWVDTSAVLAKKAKKKAMTVKALLEEKRVLETPLLPPDNVSESVANVGSKNPVTSHIIDTIESVVNARGHSDDSCSSSAGTKSQSVSVPSSETEDSQEGKANNVVQSKQNNSMLTQNNTVVTPLPDKLSTSLLEVIVSIKHAASTSDSTRKNFSSDVNSALVVLEKKSRDLPASSRHSVYAHLACFLPCTKDTLMKRAKKLFIQGEEEKMNEPMRKLKLAIDSVMPSVLERFEKEYQKFLQEKKNDAPSNGDSVITEEKKNDSLPLSKLPRKKFPWTEEMRGYLRELIRLRLQCFNVLKPRKERAEEYVSKFLNTHVRVLWPQGWMKTSTLLRESRESTAVIKPKKTSSSKSEGSKPSSSTGRLPSNISLPSSTILTPTNGTLILSKSSESNYRPKKAQVQHVVTPTAAAHAVKSGLSNSGNIFSQITSSATSTPLCLSPAASVSRTTTPSPPKKIHSPGANSTPSLSPSHVKMEPKQEGFSVDALLKRTNTENFKLEEQFKSEPTDLSKKESVSVITMNGSAMPFKELSQGKGGRIPENSGSTSASDKILDLSNGSVKSEPLQQQSVIKSVSSSNDRTTIRNSENVSSSSVFNNNNNNSSVQLPSKIRESVVTSTPVSRKQRILQDTVKSDVSANSIQQSPVDNSDLDNKKKNKKTDQKDVMPKKKIKLKIRKEPLKLEVTSPPPVPASSSLVDSHEAERRLHEETATATDILSQIISESLLGSSHQPAPAFDDEINDREREERNMHTNERKKKQRTTSGDQEAKVKMEVDQVIQDLVELRQMSGGGNSENTVDSTKSNTFGTNSVNIHKKSSHDETSKHSTFSSYQDEFYKHLLKKDSLPKTLNRTVGSYDSLQYVGEMPVKPHCNSVSSHHSNQSSSTSHQVLAGNKSSAQTERGNNANKPLPSARAVSPGQQHRPMYFPQLGFNSDDQHTNLLNLPSGLQFNWSFPGTNESSSPHQ